MRRSRTRTSRTPFRRRKRQVTWLPTPKTTSAGITLTIDGTVQFSPIEFTANMFISEGVNSRFAVAEDEVTYLRILGQLRMAMYNEVIDTPTVGDYVITYGIALVEGHYDDAGTWTEDTLPDPRNYADDPDKWLYRNMVTLASGLDFRITEDNTTATALAAGYRLRPGMLSTDEQLPFGSWLDIKPKRRARFEEKLGVIYAVDPPGDADNWTVFMNHNLRVLIGKERT